MEEIKGYVDRFLFRNEETGYSAIILNCDGDDLPVVGNFSAVSEGVRIKVEGEFVNDPRHGFQMKASSYEVLLPEDTDEMVLYLGSGAIKGVGMATAGKIVKKFGEDTFRIIEEEPERLAEIRGITEQKAIRIAEQVREQKSQRDAMVFLQKYGISGAMAVKVYDFYHENVYQIVKENPYRMAEDIEGLGFRKADEIAALVGGDSHSEYRIRSALLYLLMTGMAEGNCFMWKDTLLRKTYELIGVEAEEVETQLRTLRLEEKIFVDHKEQKDGQQRDAIFPYSLYQTEKSIAVMLQERNIQEFGYGGELEQRELQKQIQNIENAQNIQLDELQRKAVVESVRYGVSILTGGPGTGKTTTINTIIAWYMGQGKDIVLAAPTGRAAKRMTEATGYEAKTIHRLLEVNGRPQDGENQGSARFNRNEEFPLEVDAIIIDEMSMVDMFLFRALLKAMIPGTHLILVGDSSQLPSVGPGQVLRDLIESDCFATTRLEKIFRQAEESDIVMNAHRIHRGELPVMDNKSRDFFFQEHRNLEEIYSTVTELVRRRLPGYIGADSRDIQVLTPTRVGPLGVEMLNTKLQESLNPSDLGKKEVKYGERIFRTGDKVMQVKNNYQMEWEVLGRNQIAIDHGTGLFNGDMGTIQKIDTFMQEMLILFDESRTVHYPFSNLEELELAYAITIHKSQGSEYPAVVLPILDGPRVLMNRNLLYTAVTRARSCVMILGSREKVYDMARNESQLIRSTGLRDRLEEIFGRR